MFETEIKIPVYVAEDPLTVVAGDGHNSWRFGQDAEVLIQHDEDAHKIEAGEKQKNMDFYFRGLPAWRDQRSKRFAVKTLSALTTRFQIFLVSLWKKRRLFFLRLEKQTILGPKELNYLKEKKHWAGKWSGFAWIGQKENEKLNPASRPDKKTIFSAPLFPEPQSPYDIIVMGAGSDNGVKKGMRAVAYASV